MRLLICDDDASTLLDLCDAAHAEGHSADAAATVPDALGLLAGRAYDAVATDWVLGGSGGDVARAACRAGVPRVVLMSAAPPDQLADEGAAMAAEGLRVRVMQKPFGSAELLAALAGPPEG